MEKNSEYYGMVKTAKIGLAGHNQGAGAVVKQEIKMVLTGALDNVSSFSWIYPVFEDQQENGNDGIYAVHSGAGHSNLNLYLNVAALWWQYQLNPSKESAGTDMKKYWMQGCGLLKIPAAHFHKSNKQTKYPYSYKKTAQLMLGGCDSLDPVASNLNNNNLYL